MWLWPSQSCGLPNPALLLWWGSQDESAGMPLEPKGTEIDLSTSYFFLLFPILCFKLVAKLYWC